MAVKLAMVMKVAVLALLLAAVSVTARSSVDLFDLLASNNPEALQLVKQKKPIMKPCCNNCMCNKKYPQQCVCTDIFIGLDRCANCEGCLCTRSMPPQCRCVDVKDYCLPECKTTTTGFVEAVVAAEIESSN